MGILFNENAISSGGYQISNSLRFQSASSTYLTRTPASASNRTTWTWSAWVKRGALGSQMLEEVYNAANDNQCLNITFQSSDQLQIGAFSTNYRVTTQVFRDPSAWYHIVVVADTTQATANNRLLIYVNGTQVTAFSTLNNPSQNQQLAFNQNVVHALGARNGGTIVFDGYMTEVNFIDGQALTPSSFGETNALTGQWVAKKYTGTYGTNGFYLPFSNGTSTTTLGADSSGNSNNWTLNNFTRSAGVSDCWMYDVPSGNGSAGTQPNSNYAVMNPVSPLASGSITNANLKFTSGNADCISVGTVGVFSGKWYWEVTATTVNGSSTYIGILGVPPASITVDLSVPSNGYSYRSNGEKGNNNSRVAYGASYTSGDVIGVALDMDAGTLVFYKNNASQGTAYSSLSGTFTPAVSDGSGASGGAVIDANFGQRSFAYTPPSGFKALCTANLPASTIKQGNKYMDATLWTGNGSTQTITNAAGFSPDLVWTKGRSNGNSNLLFDTVRGVGNWLSSNQTAAETNSATSLTAFNSNGFSLGSYGDVNTNTFTFVGWQWDAGSSTVTNTNGSISSQVRANSTAGVSVVTYTGNGGTNATVGHGLGVAPQVILAKVRSTSADWECYFASVGATKVLHINTNQAPQTLGHWGNTSPTSSVFTVNASGTGSEINGNGSTYVAYCFAEIAGFSKFGSYTGNGSADGTFCYTGFQPKFIMVKRTDTTSNWFIYDTARNTYNAASTRLYPDLSNVEDTGGSLYDIDILSNGFKLRGTGQINASGSPWIYACFATNPFQNSNAR